MTSLKKLFLTVFTTGLIFGIGMEFFQEAFTNRQFSWWDGFADMIGLFLGLGIAKKSPYGNRGRNQN
jgi:VanZ family protein